MLDLIHHNLKSSADITAMTGAGDTTRIFPYFRQPDEATTYPAIYFEQDERHPARHDRQHRSRGVAYDSFVVVISCVSTTLSEAWELFHKVRVRMTTVPGYWSPSRTTNGPFSTGSSMTSKWT